MGPGALHLLFHTGMDGGAAFSLSPTHVLVCCQNTLALALASRQSLRLRHVGPIADRVQVLCAAAATGMEDAKRILRMIEASDVLVDLRADEFADFTFWSLRGEIGSRPAVVDYWRAAQAPNQELQGRSSVARVVQIATYVGSHGTRSNPRSLLLGAHRAAVNGTIDRLLKLDGNGGRLTVNAFRKAYADAAR